MKNPTEEISLKIMYRRNRTLLTSEFVQRTDKFFPSPEGNILKEKNTNICQSDNFSRIV